MAINGLSSNERYMSWNEQEVEAFLEEEENEKWHRIFILKTINMPYFEKASKPIDRNSINDILAEKKKEFAATPYIQAIW